MTYRSRDWSKEGDWKRDDDQSLLGGSFTGSFLDDQNFLDSSRAYRAARDDVNSPILAGQGVFSNSGAKSLVGGTLDQFTTEAAFGADSLNQKAERIAQKTLAEAAKEAAEKEAEGRKAGSIWSTIGSIASAGLGLALCDERCKVDIDDLGVVEQGDSLAKIAYEVKWLRELA